MIAELTVAEVPSPLGPLHVVVGERGVCALVFHDRWEEERRALARRVGDHVLRPGGGGAPADALAAYLRGDLGALTDLPLDPDGTDFQRRVWEALRRVPPGATTSYGELARAVGSPAAVRAVGAANAKNPIPILIPCHRVVGSDGSLTGYSGGLDRKRWLLSHESAQRPLLPLDP
jgi:methylated-DNA-[protein]-cysteine S-methyltransferase